MKKKIFVLVITMLVFLVSPMVKAEENRGEISIEPRTGGVWFQYSEQGHKVTYKTVEGYAGNQPSGGYLFGTGGYVSVDRGGSPISVSVSLGYGPYSLSATLGSVAEGVTDKSVYFAPNVRGRVYSRKVYKVTQYKVMKRMFGRGEWKFERYDAKVELVNEDYFVR